VDKVLYLRDLQAMPSAAARRGQLLLFQGRHAMAEEALLSARLAWAAVELNLGLFNWQRALALAQQAGEARLVDAVLWHRCAACPVVVTHRSLALAAMRRTCCKRRHRRT
jgi:hypothetical protein